MEKDLTTLLNEFLQKSFSSKKEMAVTIADLLDIEIDSAYRRMNGTVAYKSNEIGVLATALNLSLDSILAQVSGFKPTLFQVYFEAGPLKEAVLSELLKQNLEAHRAMEPNALMGVVCESIPIEMYAEYPALLKFMFFKWGHYHVGTREYDNFEDWEMPDNLIEHLHQLKEWLHGYRKVTYIWDHCVIFNLVSEINHHIEIQTLTPACAACVKADLIRLLEDLNELLCGKKMDNPQIDFYITYFNVGATVYYVDSTDRFLTGISTPLIFFSIHKDIDTGRKVQQWVESVKKFSCLISGSGEKQRVEFFKKQREYLELIKC